MGVIVVYPKLCYARPSPNGGGLIITMVDDEGNMANSQPLSVEQMEQIEDAIIDAYRRNIGAVGQPTAPKGDD